MGIRSTYDQTRLGGAISVVSGGDGDEAGGRAVIEQSGNSDRGLEITYTQADATWGLRGTERTYPTRRASVTLDGEDSGESMKVTLPYGADTTPANQNTWRMHVTRGDPGTPEVPAVPAVQATVEMETSTGNGLRVTLNGPEGTATNNFEFSLQTEDIDSDTVVYGSTGVNINTGNTRFTWKVRNDATLGTLKTAIEARTYTVPDPDMTYSAAYYGTATASTDASGLAGGGSGTVYTSSGGVDGVDGVPAVPRDPIACVVDHTSAVPEVRASADLTLDSGASSKGFRVYLNGDLHLTHGAEGNDARLYVSADSSIRGVEVGNIRYSPRLSASLLIGNDEGTGSHRTLWAAKKAFDDYDEHGLSFTTEYIGYTTYKTVFYFKSSTESEGDAFQVGNRVRFRFDLVANPWTDYFEVTAVSHPSSDYWRVDLEDPDGALTDAAAAAGGVWFQAAGGDEPPPDSSFQVLIFSAGATEATIRAGLANSESAFQSVRADSTTTSYVRVYVEAYPANPNQDSIVVGGSIRWTYHQGALSDPWSEYYPITEVTNNPDGTRNEYTITIGPVPDGTTLNPHGRNSASFQVEGANGFQANNYLLGSDGQDVFDLNSGLFLEVITEEVAPTTPVSVPEPGVKLYGAGTGGTQWIVGRRLRWAWRFPQVWSDWGTITDTDVTIVGTRWFVTATLDIPYSNNPRPYTAYTTASVQVENFNYTTLNLKDSAQQVRDDNGGLYIEDTAPSVAHGFLQSHDFAGGVDGVHANREVTITAIPADPMTDIAPAVRTEFANDFDNYADSDVVVTGTGTLAGSLFHADVDGTTTHNFSGAQTETPLKLAVDDTARTVTYHYLPSQDKMERLRDVTEHYDDFRARLIHATADNATPTDPADIATPFETLGATGGDGRDGSDGLPGAAGDDGAPGRDGDDGEDGWTPLPAVASDSDRRVLEITDWTGGTGTKPAVGYLGTSGIVSAIADGVDIRGASGTSSGSVLDAVLPGSEQAAVAANHHKIQNVQGRLRVVASSGGNYVRRNLTLPTNVVRFYGQGQTVVLPATPPDRSRTQGNYLRYQWSAQLPTVIGNGTDFGVRAQTDAGDADAMTGETIATRTIIRFPTALYRFDFEAVHRAESDKDLFVWMYEVKSGTDDIIAFSASGEADDATSSPFGDTANWYGQHLRFSRVMNVVNNTDFTFLAGPFDDDDDVDGAWALTITQMG